MAVAHAVGGDWPKNIREAAIALTADRDEQDAGTQLLADLVEIFADRNQDILPSADLLARLTTMEERRWPEWSHGKPMSARGLASLLGRYKVKPKKYRTGIDTIRGYSRPEIEAVAKRYVPPSHKAEQAEQPTKTLENRAVPVPLGNSQPDTRSGTENPAKTDDVPHVPHVPLVGEAGGKELRL